MRRTLLLSISLAAMTWAASAAADSPRLRGQYSFTGSATCINSAAPFSSEFTPTVPPTWIESFAVKGVRTFDGNGNGTVTGSSMVVEFGPPGHNHASSSDFQFSFTYAVDGNGGWTSDIAGSLTGAVTSGPGAGLTFTVAGFPRFTGSISQDGSTLTAATLTPTMETVSHSDGNTVYRICHRSRVLIRLPEGNSRGN